MPLDGEPIPGESSIESVQVRTERIDSDYFPARFEKLSEGAKIRYEKYDKEKEFRKEAELMEDFEPIQPDNEYKRTPTGKGRIFVSKDGTKVLKMVSCPTTGYKTLSEGPTILTMRDILKDSGKDSDLLPEVTEFGVTEKGVRYIITEKIEGERVFQPKYKFRDKSQRLPKPEELMRLVSIFTEYFSIFEQNGFYPAADYKQENVFLTNGKMRMIDWDVTFTEKKPYEEQIKELYLATALNYLGIVSKLNYPVSHLREKIKDIDFVAEQLEKLIPKASERLMFSSFLQFLAGEHNVAPTHESVGRAISFYNKVTLGMQPDQESGVSSELINASAAYSAYANVS